MWKRLLAAAVVVALMAACSGDAEPEALSAESSAEADASYDLAAESESAQLEPVSPEHVPIDLGSSYEESSYQQYSGLTAGEIDDNAHWVDYLRYRDRYADGNVHDVDIAERYVIRVRGHDRRGVPNAQVSISGGGKTIFKGRTYTDGRTLFHPRAFASTVGVETFRLYVEKDGSSKTLDVSRGEGHEWVVDLDVAGGYPVGSVPLDLLFLLDATGSMADEIDQIKSSLLLISSRISELPSQPDLRFGMVTYRDRGDEYVTRLYDFDSKARDFLNSIRNVSAEGGGDEPESLNEALHVAVNDPDWRLGNAVRLIFLVSDAPPHLNYVNDYNYVEEMMTAHERGVKIFAIASSGLSPQGEYIFRQIAQHTMGRFIFTLYAGKTPHEVSEYSVELLDDLVVRLVEEELGVLEE